MMGIVLLSSDFGLKIGKITKKPNLSMELFLSLRGLQTNIMPGYGRG